MNYDTTDQAINALAKIEKMDKESIEASVTFNLGIMQFTFTNRKRIDSESCSQRTSRFTYSESYHK